MNAAAMQFARMDCAFTYGASRPQVRANAFQVKSDTLATLVIALMMPPRSSFCRPMTRSSVLIFDRKVSGTREPRTAMANICRTFPTHLR